MITTGEITGHLQEARERGLNLYWKPLTTAISFGVRITRARTRKGMLEVFALGSGKWYAVKNGDAFYIE